MPPPFNPEHSGYPPPEHEAFHRLFVELNTQVDAAGNRSLAKVLEQHPFPIYEATVRRHHMLREHPTDVEEFAVKVGGAIREVVVAGFDLIWDVATAPAHLTLYPKMRHPLYKATLATLADYGKRENMRYTTRMASTPRTEGEHPPIAQSPGMPTDAIPPLPPEGIPPALPAEPIRSEQQENSPQREAFHQLMRDILEVTEPALREDTHDRFETTAALGERTAQAWQDLTKTPWDIPRHIRQFDTALRGRDLGSMKIRLGRTLTYHAIRAITTGVDGVEDIAKFPLLMIPGGGFISAGVEFLSDELIRAGTEWTVQQATQTRQARFASPIAVAASRIFNIFPIFGMATNAPGLETRMRSAYNLPIVGVPVEYVYREANRLLTRIERNPRGQWMERFVLAVLGGTRREEDFRQERERAPTTQTTQAPPATS